MKWNFKDHVWSEYLKAILCLQSLKVWGKGVCAYAEPETYREIFQAWKGRNFFGIIFSKHIKFCLPEKRKVVGFHDVKNIEKSCVKEEINTENCDEYDETVHGSPPLVNLEEAQSLLTLDLFAVGSMDLEYFPIPEGDKNARKTTSGRIKKERYRYPESTEIKLSARMGKDDTKLPLKCSEAMRGPQEDTWYSVMKAKIDEIESSKTRNLVLLPSDVKPVVKRWMHDLKVWWE